jgi:hypothetical protein
MLVFAKVTDEVFVHLTQELTFSSLVLMNLIGVSQQGSGEMMNADACFCQNAVKFTDEGSVKCTVSLDPNRPTPDPEMVSIKFIIQCVTILIAVSVDLSYP